MSRRHPATDLLIQRYHERHHHCNYGTTISEIRMKYYIPRILAEFNRIRRSCQMCKIRNAAPSPPMMGEIPSQRTAIAQSAFLYTGLITLITLDRFGCLSLSDVGQKCVGGNFHLPNDKSHPSRSPIRRFIGRRGSPREIISERGTNFVGAARELDATLKVIDDEAVMTAFCSPQLKSSFNPPGAPHFGGCWERLVKSVKRVMSQMTLPRLPTDELLQSTLTEIELVVNSRPLTYVPLNDEADPPMTPKDLLLGSSDGSKTVAAFYASAAAVKSAWSTAQQNADLFWKKRVADYLPMLTQYDRLRKETWL
uniref:Integrase catalytic domain-containing protein n=1 Tax=Anopheles christyi TaxID=43041 RepID=A0A182KHE0_9DIPT